MAHLKPQYQLDFSRSATDWIPWKKRFDRYRIASKLAKNSGNVQVNTLLYAMGPQSEGVFAQFSLSEDDSKKYDVVITKFDNHLAPKRNVIHERAMFNKRDQFLMSQQNRSYEYSARWPNVVISVQPKMMQFEID